MVSSVVSGDYKGKIINNVGGVLSVSLNFRDYVLIDRYGVESYEVIDRSSDPSFSSVLVRSTIGEALLGETGEIIGALTAKSTNIYHVVVRFKDGKKCN